MVAITRNSSVSSNENQKNVAVIQTYKNMVEKYAA